MPYKRDPMNGRPELVPKSTTESSRINYAINKPLPIIIIMNCVSRNNSTLIEINHNHLATTLDAFATYELFTLTEYIKALKKVSTKAISAVYY
jgi:hypothetical protein